MLSKEKLKKFKDTFVSVYFAFCAWAFALGAGSYAGYGFLIRINEVTRQSSVHNVMLSFMFAIFVGAMILLMFNYYNNKKGWRD